VIETQSLQSRKTSSVGFLIIIKLKYKYQNSKNDRFKLFTTDPHHELTILKNKDYYFNNLRPIVSKNQILFEIYHNSSIFYFEKENFFKEKIFPFQEYIMYT